MTDYKKQYLKYKNKYLKIKKMLGGNKTYKILEDLQQDIKFSSIIPNKENIGIFNGLPPPEKGQSPSKEEQPPSEEEQPPDDSEDSDDSDDSDDVFDIDATLALWGREAEQIEEEEAKILAKNTVSIIAVIGGIVGLVFLIK